MYFSLLNSNALVRLNIILIFSKNRLKSSTKNLQALLMNFLNREEATTASCAFCLRQEKDDQKVVLEDKDLEVIGAPIIKYGDSTVIVQHSETGLWLSYKVSF